MSDDTRASGPPARQTATRVRPTSRRTHHVSHAGRFVPAIAADDPSSGPRHVIGV